MTALAGEIAITAPKSSAYVVDKKKVAGIVTVFLQATGLVSANVNVSFVDGKAMRALNRRFRGKDHGTDVLSFPQQRFADFPRLPKKARAKTSPFEAGRLE